MTRSTAPLVHPIDPFAGFVAPVWNSQLQQQQARQQDPATPPATPPAAGDPPTPPADPATPPATPPAAPPATPPATPATPPINPRTGQPYTPEETQAHIAQLNAEAKTQREAKETAERERDAATARANAILRAAGFNPDGTPYTEITPEQAEQQIQGTQAERDNTARENLVLRVSGTTEHRANADALLDSREFVSKLAAIGINDRAGVEALVDEYVGKDATRYGVTLPAASSGGGPHTGTPPTQARKSKSEAIAAQYPGRPASPGTAATT